MQQPNQKGAKFTVNQETGEIFTNKVTAIIIMQLYFILILGFTFPICINGSRALNVQLSHLQVFDREGDDGKFVSVTVKATDHGDPALEGVCSFTVEIEDQNGWLRRIKSRITIDD